MKKIFEIVIKITTYIIFAIMLLFSAINTCYVPGDRQDDGPHDQTELSPREL